MFNKDITQLDAEQRLAYRADIQRFLTENTATVEFRKADGSVRTMRCSLRAEDRPAPTERRTDRVRPENTETLSVVDLDIGEWRSFRIDSLLSVRV
jgi:hypothetical protein